MKKYLTIALAATALVAVPAVAQAKPKPGLSVATAKSKTLALANEMAKASGGTNVRLALMSIDKPGGSMCTRRGTVKVRCAYTIDYPDTRDTCRDEVDVQLYPRRHKPGLVLAFGVSGSHKCFPTYGVWDPSVDGRLLLPR